MTLVPQSAGEFETERASVTYKFEDEEEEEGMAEVVRALPARPPLTPPQPPQPPRRADRVLLHPRHRQRPHSRGVRPPHGLLRGASARPMAAGCCLIPVS